MNASRQSPQHVKITATPNTTILTLTDSSISDEVQAMTLRDEMADAFQRADSKDIVVDMKHVEYISSIAMMPFITLRKAAEEVGGRVVLCNLTDVVAKVLAVCQLIVESRSHAEHMRLADDLDAAIKMLGHTC